MNGTCKCGGKMRHLCESSVDFSRKCARCGIVATQRKRLKRQRVTSTSRDNPYFVGMFWCPVHLRSMPHHVIFAQRLDITDIHVRVLCITCAINYCNTITDDMPKTRTIYLNNKNANTAALMAAHNIHLV